MSKIQATPFIQKVIATLSTEEKTSLAALINGSDTEPSFKSLINPIYKITSEDEGVSYCILETQDKTFTGYLLYTDTYCVFVAFAQDTQSLSVLNINLTNQTYKFVEESLTILELRFSLEEAKEEGDIISTVQEALDDETLEVNKLNTEEGSAVKLIGYDTEGNLVEDEIPEGIVVDDALNTESDNAIANAPVAQAFVNVENGTIVAGKALSAKSLEAVSTESGAVQDTPFIYQGTGTANGTSIADTSPVGKHLEKQGNSVVVNQLVSKPFFTDGTTGWYASHMSQSVSGGVDTLTVTEESQACEISCTINSIVSGHKYLLFVSHQSAQVGSINATISKSDWSAYATMGVDMVSSTNVWRTYTRVVTATFSGTSAVLHIYPIGGNAQVGDIAKIRGVIFIDLTQWFAGNIPQDLLDHPENFFRYYNGSLEYNAGSMENGTGRYLTCGGRNLWDEEWEVGLYNVNTGAKDTGNYVRNKNPIRVTPNTDFYLYSGSAKKMRVLFYDIDGNFISSHADWLANQTIKTPANCAYVNFFMESTYGTTYNHDITISLYYATGDSYDQYFPHEEPKVYDTGSETLLSAGSVRDVKLPDGTITRNGETMTINGSTPVFNSSQMTSGNWRFMYKPTPAIVKGKSSWEVISGKLTSNYNIVSPRISATGTGIGATISHINGDKSIGIVVDGITTAEGLTAYLNEHPCYVNYALDEPTTEQGTPFAENIEINDYGTMAWDSEVPQGCKIFYPADYALFVDSVGQRQDINWDALAIVSHTELNNETDALEAKDTQLLNALGGTLRQLLAVSKSIDFANTDFIDLSELSWFYDSTNTRFVVVFTEAKEPANRDTVANVICTKYKEIANNQASSLTKVVYLDGGNLYIKDSSYTDATAFKNAMKGVLLAYEKAE